MFTQEEKSKMFRLVSLLIIIISLFFVVKIATGIKAYGMLGSDKVATNTININGSGEVFVVPDVAKISFTIHTEGKNMDTAQKANAEIYAKVKEGIKPFAIEEKNIKTESYTANPKYEWKTESQTGMPCSTNYCPPSGGKNVLTGYTVDQNISIKLPAIDRAGEFIDVLGKAGVSNMQAPEYTVSDEDNLKAQARKKAIDDAQIKAEVLAKDLGVKLVRIISFSENNGGGYPVPMYATDSSMAKVTVASTELPKGENKIMSDVSITYEIR